jgi:hypothetical protein
LQIASRKVAISAKPISNRKSHTTAHRNSIKVASEISTMSSKFRIANNEHL